MTVRNQKKSFLLPSNKKKPVYKKKAILKELFILAIPYLISSILGYSQSIFNGVLLPTGLKMHYTSTDMISTIISATSYVGVKLTAIPMVLAPGFTAAIIPHITTALTQNNKKLVRKNVIDCLNVVLYIGLPVAFCLFVYSAPLNYTLFNTDDLATGTMVIQWLTIEAITGFVLPVVTNLMMALKLQPKVLKRLAINAVIKGVLMVPLATALLGYGGAVIASLIADAYLIISCLHQISVAYHISYNKVIAVVLRIGVGLLALWLVATGLNHIGLDGLSNGKLVCLVKMCINGCISMLVYVAVTVALKIPQLDFISPYLFQGGRSNV